MNDHRARRLNTDAPTPAGGGTPPNDPAAEALKAAMAAISDLQNNVNQAVPTPEAPADEPDPPPAPAVAPPPPGSKPMALPVFTPKLSAHQAKTIGLLSDVSLNVKIELGRTRMLVEDVLKLAEGAVVELDKLAGDPVDIYVNDRPVARGEVLVLNDSFCVRVNEIIQNIAEPDAKTKATAA